MARTVAIVGVPTSAGAFAAGQERAPAALRAAGLVESLRQAGVEVDDHGDREPGARPELVGAGEHSPLLRPELVVLFAWGPEQATEFEREAIARSGIATVPVDEVAADPEAAAARALELLEPRCDRLLVHFDVDVVDFTDTPLSENTGRNEGLPFETALRALEALLATPLLAGLTITELNPDHTEEGAGAVERLVTAVATGLGR